jgi:hypothetical protein
LVCGLEKATKLGYDTNGVKFFYGVYLKEGNETKNPGCIKVEKIENQLKLF